MQYGQPSQFSGAPQDQPCDPQPKPMTQSRPPQSYTRKSQELYHPPAFHNTTQQNNRDTIQPRQCVGHNQLQFVIPQPSPVKGDFETMMRKVIKEELRKTMEPLRSASHSSGVPEGEEIGLTAIHLIQLTQIMKIALDRTPGITVLLVNHPGCKFQRCPSLVKVGDDSFLILRL